MKDQIVTISEAFRLNKKVVHNNRNVIAAYFNDVNYYSGQIRIRLTNLETEVVNIMELEVLND